MVAALGKVISAPLKALGIISTPKVDKTLAQTPLPVATRDTAAQLIAREDELRRRKGGAADVLTGPGGAEASLTGGKITLGS